jgi:thiol-disulfide isomerase/thioredoxin
VKRSLAIAALGLVVSCTTHIAPPEELIASVREHSARGDFAGGERVVADYRAAGGAVPVALEALSVLAQGAAAAKQGEKAQALARETYDLAGQALKGRKLDDEPRLPVALGRAIEILAQASAGQGMRTEAIGFLEREIRTYGNTSIEKRIQKNINLLTLEGTQAPELDLSDSLGNAPPTLASLNGKVVLMFFWAHWCADCKAQGPILASLKNRYGPQGLTIVAPTQRYGYVAGGATAAPEVETPYIGEVRRTYYPMLAGLPIPLSEQNHRRYGVSSTPTLVLVDRAGVIRLYHPGRMPEAELEPLVRRLVEDRQPRSSS